MPRDLPNGNGSLIVAFDAQKQLSDALGLEGAKGEKKTEEGSNE